MSTARRHQNRNHNGNRPARQVADTRAIAPADHHREVYRSDGWTNLLIGLGSRIDKTKGTVSLFDRIISDEELESTYLDDGLGTNIVNMIPEDMFREGWDHTFPDLDELEAEELSKKYDAIMETIGAPEKLEEGVDWARLYGGAIILIGALDGGNLENALRPAKIKTFEYLRIIDRSDISFDKMEFQFDPLKPRYGLPEYYPVSFKKGKTGLTEVKRVHHSRVIEIHGERVPAGATKTLTEEQRYWGVSVLQRVYRRLEILGASIGGVGALLNEISIGKYKIRDLAGVLEQPDGDRIIKKRVELMDLCKSVFRSMYFDAGDETGKGAEDFIRENLQLGGVDAVLYIIMMLVSADTGYPITRLFGVSPAGMNATGESDMRNYYDKVRSRQQRVLKPMILQIVKIISKWQKLPEPFIEFRPLKQMSEKEQAELEKTQADKDKAVADTYKAYYDMGVLDPYQIKFLQFGDSLDTIPVPEDEDLPPVETVPEENPEGDMDEKEVLVRIKELEAKEELTEEEEVELEKLQAGVVEIRKSRGGK